MQQNHSNKKERTRTCPISLSDLAHTHTHTNTQKGVNHSYPALFRPVLLPFQTLNTFGCYESVSF